MIPFKFPEATKPYKAPADLEESQCMTIWAYENEVVVAWLPTDEEVDRIVAGEPIFLSVMGGLPPHYLSTSFEEATHPA